MRHREQSSMYPYATQSFSKTAWDSSTVTTDWFEAAGNKKEIDDCLTPGYRQVLAAGGVVPYQYVRIETRDISVTPLSGELKVVTGPHAPWLASWGDHVGSAVSDYILPLEPGEHDESTVSYLVNAAISRAKMGAWDALSSLAEAHKDVSGIADRMNRVFNFATSAAHRARRGKTLGARIEQFERYWLEGRYQWRPLVGEIRDITQHLEKGTQNRQIGRSSYTTNLSGSVASSPVAVGPRLWSANSSLTGTRTYKGYAMAVGSIVSANLSPPQTAWELLPYSFVVDMFMDIGSAINAWAPLPGVDVPVSGVSIHDHYTVTQVVSAFDNPAVTDSVASYPQSYRRITEVDRYKRLPRGAMAPSFHPRLSPANYMDLLLLATARARRVTNLLKRG